MDQSNIVILAIVVTSLATYLSRFLGAVTSEKLSEMNSMVTEDEIDKKKIASLNDKILTLFNEEIEWRNKASVSLFDKLNEYDDSIKNTIGLRLQERLTKKQAKFVSKCRSIHRDISLNF